MKLLVSLSVACLLVAPIVRGQQDPAPSPPPPDPYFLGYETEPAMDFAGRDLASVTRGLSELLDHVVHAERRPKIRLAYELPLAIPIMLVQHEVAGHGARAREQGLPAEYGVWWDLSAYTSIEEVPESNEGVALLAAGGTEADGVLARRLLVDAHRARGGAGNLVPLLLMAKLDLPMYVSMTPEPRPAAATDDENQASDDLVAQYTAGNDMALYLVARQALRQGDGPEAVWNQTYEVDLGEDQIHRNWQELRATAVWTLLDPAFASTVVSYFKEHISRGEPEVHPLRIRLGHGLGLTLSTRAALAPTYVTRFLDVLLTSPRGVFSLYLRDLDSSQERTFGLGVAAERMELSRMLVLGLQGDLWREPDSPEGGRRRDGWNVTLEADLLARRNLGVSMKVGAKSAGFFPGRPVAEGAYFGFGGLFRF